MAELAETRDSDTGNHVQRTQSYVAALGRALQADPVFAPELSEAKLQRIVKAAPMHDIGKIGIPDGVLLKPERLSQAEFEIMKTHARLGGNAIAHAIHKASAMHADKGLDNGDALPESLRFLEVARLIATHHHERWDGLGYPDGLAGDAIPLAARLMALADVFDALTTRRVYKAPWPLEEAVRYITSQSGRHFDPRLVLSFTRVADQFSTIARQLAD